MNMYSLNIVSRIIITMGFQVLLHLTSHSTAQPPSLICSVCQDTFGNYTSNSTYQQNLNKLFSTITSNTDINYGFYNVSVGRDFDIVNGIGLCYPDVSVDDCKGCLSQAAAGLVQVCPAQKDAIGWFENCMMRYTDRYIFSKLEYGPWFQESNHFIRNIYAGVNDVKFNQTASNLLRELQLKAAAGDSRRKFGAGKANVYIMTLYALVQCTPDLEYADCYDCLDSAISFSLTEAYGNSSRVYYTSCSIRYETYPFFDLDAAIASLKPLQPPPLILSPPPSTPMRKGRGRSKKSRVLIIVLLPVIICLVFLVALFTYYFLRKTSKTDKKLETGDENRRSPDSLQMDFDTIKSVTGNFSVANELGQGGFGKVYKGKLSTGEEIAVKRLLKKPGQGEEEFKNEAVLVARLRHRNLVSFLGFCLEGEERLLIYELLPNKSLDNFLFDPAKRSNLDWLTRNKIIGGVVRGLVYLHEESRMLIVHRDLKAGNILLDAEMNPKIADFGMARLFGADQTQGDTRNICGTYGYMPPEYVQQGHFSIKSDIYGFGVLLLEIISGQRIGNYNNAETGENLLSYVWRNWLEDTPLNVVDPLMPAVNTTQVFRCIHIGLLCVQENMAHRPLMSSVVLMLSVGTVSPPMPSRPAFLLHNNDEEALPSKAPQLEVVISGNEVSISEIDPR